MVLMGSCLNPEVVLKKQYWVYPVPVRFGPIWLRAGLLAVWAGGLAGCVTTLPSETFKQEVTLPVPQSALALPSADRLSMAREGELYRLTPLRLISLAFDLQPDIKSSFQRFRSEEARYDFFFSSRDSLTPRMRLTNRVGDFRADETVDRERDHDVEFSVEKRFFDTTELDIAAGYRTSGLNEDIGNHPFVSANVRYPLAASRQKLERASEDIFRQNELSDVQLAYIQQVRSRLQNVLFRFYDVLDLKRRVEHLTQWVADLRGVLDRLRAIGGRDVSEDIRRLEAEIGRVASNLRIRAGRYEIQVARLKSAIGLPFHAVLELADEPFNPFGGSDHEALLRLSIETDPEIASLRNSMNNAEVQLDLARRGTWDVAILLGATGNLEGRGEEEGISDWSASLGLDVSRVDPRVTGSLARQAQANIHRFEQAIVARENTIFVDTLEPLVRIETISASREQLLGTLPKYTADFETGISLYEQGELNVDDLIQRRENMFDQQREISRLTLLVGANVAELCAATGKFFELLDGEHDGDDVGSDAPPS